MKLLRRGHHAISFHNSVKKSKVEDNVVDDEESDILISRLLKRKRKPGDESFSMVKIKKFVSEQLAVIEESIEECHVEEQRLQSLKRDINKCSKGLANKKMQVKCVRDINQVHEKLFVKIEECALEFVVKEAQLCLMEDLIGEQKLEFKTKEMELHQIKLKENEFRRVVDKIDKDCERKEEELRVVSFKIDECTKELRIKEKELDAMEELIGVQAKKLESMKKQFEGQVREHEFREKKLEGGMEEFKSKKKVFEGLVKDFESKEMEFQGQKEVLISEKMCFEIRVKELESKEKQLEGQIKEFESKKGEFECLVKDLESQKKNFESKVKEVESKNKYFEVE